MKFFVSVKVLAFFCLLCAWAAPCFAQTPLKELRVEYNKAYQLENSYTIIYDNTTAAAKVKDFKVVFLGPGRTKIGSTEIETYPLTGKIEGYNLSEPIIGFTEVQLLILSLYAGDISDLSSNANSILALNELTEVPETVNPIIVNAVPLAKNGGEDFEARTEGFSVNISELYSDPDGDALTVTRRSEENGPFPYLLEADGTLNIIAPTHVGRYDVLYEVRDPEGARASGEIVFDVLFPKTLQGKLNDASTSTVLLLTALDEAAQPSTEAPKTPANLKSRLEKILSENQSLSAEITAVEAVALKADINQLTESLNAAQRETSHAGFVDKIENLKSQTIALQAKLAELKTASEITGTDITNFEDALNAATRGLPVLEGDIENLKSPLMVTVSDIDRWEEEHGALKARVKDVVETSNPGLPWAPIAVAAGILLLGLVLKMTGVLGGKGKLPHLDSNSRNNRPRPKHADGTGVIFPASPLLVANVVAPLGATGQLTASQLQMLNGPYTVLRAGYEATGRIGYAQNGIPGAEDYSFGTGFLVTDRHVVTNRHVYGLYGHYLLNTEDPGGIEFIAEKGKKASDFIAFNGKPPLLIPDLDIAIFTLSRPATKRKPLAVKPRDSADLDGREIVVIGYPDTHTPENPEILSVVETDPVFAVKRLSRGKIFRHSTDTDTPYGVKTQVTEDEKTNFEMSAICHNASTLGGNSGSPLLDLRTGALLGVHFAGFKVFNQKEAANLAMTIAQLAECGRIKDLDS